MQFYPRKGLLWRHIIRGWGRQIPPPHSFKHRGNDCRPIDGTAPPTTERFTRQFLDPTREQFVDVTTEAGAFFGCKFDRQDKELLLDITIVSLCVSSNLDDVGRRAGKNLANAIE